MDMNKLTIVPMLQKHDLEIAKWRYDDVYSFYNRTESGEFTGDANDRIDNAFAVYDNDTLIGFFHYGADGQIPTIEKYNYSSDYLDIGLGLHPSLCGRGYGKDFVNLVLEYGRKNYQATKFRLSVAAFNERAIKVYEAVGFCRECEVTNSYFKNKFYILKKD